MAVNKDAYKQIIQELEQRQVTLVAVSKTKPAEDVLELYSLGQRDFGENYVQELISKAHKLPKDIRWHFIGHLQTNKVKLIVPFVQLIHGVDSLKLLKEINKEAEKAGRVVDCLLQVHIAREETKFGFSKDELLTILCDETTVVMKNIRICGLMGMASFTDDAKTISYEFKTLSDIFTACKKNRTKNLIPETLSMGMSSDYKLAIEEGSTMVRIGSLLFGERVSNK